MSNKILQPSLELMDAGRNGGLRIVKGTLLPFDIDFSTWPDGPLPGIFIGPTFAISSHKLINDPGIIGAANLLTDGSLEANPYADGQCPTLTKGGSPTLVESADAHAGARAQQFTPTVFNDRLNFPTVASVANAWYRFSGWAKKIAGTGSDTRFSIYMTAGRSSSLALVGAAYTKHQISTFATGAGLIFCYPAIQSGSSAYDTVIVDDWKLERLAHADLFALIDTGQSDVIMKVVPDILDDTISAAVVRANAQMNPTDYLMAVWNVAPYNVVLPYINVSLYRCVGGAYTVLIGEAAQSIVDGAWLEVRAIGSVVSVWYNNVQVGANQSDATTGKYVGANITGGNTIRRLFAGTHLTDYSAVFAGSSFTSNDSTGYRPILQSWMYQNNPAYWFHYTTEAAGGNNTWSNLVRLSAECLSQNPNVVVFDTANDDDNAKDKASLEAMIRRIWAANPNTQIIGVGSPSWNGQDIGNDANVNHPSNEAALGNVAALLAYYGIPLADYWGWCKAVVPDTYHLNELTADTVHPTALGYTHMAELCKPYLPMGGAAKPDVLPARFYDIDGEYENTPMIKNGVDYDSKIGVWTEASPQISTSEVDATITYSGTFRSIGCSNSDCPAIDYRVDGGDWVLNQSLYQNGRDLGIARGAHTVTLRCRTTMKVVYFWAV